MKSSVTVTDKTHSHTAPSVPADQIQSALEGSKRVVIVSHVDPDGDAIGTQLAFGGYLRAIGKEVLSVRDSGIPDKYAFLPEVETIIPVEALRDIEPPDTALILECPSIERMGRVADFLREGMTTILIDHHRDSTPFGDVNWIDVGASSVGELAWMYFREIGFSLSTDMATQLYAAVLTDTGRFRYGSTTQRTMICAGELIAAGANPHRICDEVYYNQRPAVMKLMGKVLNEVEFHERDTICVLKLTKDMLAQSGARESDSEGLVDFTLFNRGVVAGALLKEVDEHSTRVSLRSNNHVDVSAIAQRFDGGGHYNAAGCTMPWGMERARKEIVAILKEAQRA
jgi:phosphoesterase RecJ-like protein